ncbi:hypothetical protein A7A78_07965 [Aequorivita soesokkakensis]|uniref:GIY-YIG domain-containing protein n=1 Tax=Aequorivita soesokkakensis TaxID=1385699 RepID=A0A1A9LAC7_9FLAO|nr:hypothetical protein [Aequorivita soesokkakensis]OAD90143.1 hypothetical protein A7A78_07965 [Aequorivita soesokkakensis]
MFSQTLITTAPENILKSKVYTIHSLVNQDRKYNYKKELPNNSGCYAFWWINNCPELRGILKNAQYYIKLSHKKYNCDEDHFEKIQFTNEWIDASTHQVVINDRTVDAICLYVGKSTNMRNRVQAHLKLNVDDIWKKIEVKKNAPYTAKRLREVKFGFGQKPNTVSQLRIGLERVFNAHCVDVILKNVALSWMPLNKEQNNLVNRFYIEDKLVSCLFPLFNIDAER